MQEGHTIELKEEAPLLKRRKQKPGPGRSSEGLVPTGTRVFALWADDHHYYSGVIQRRVHDKYVVRYDSDGTEVALPLTDMRPCSKLLVGDSVLLIKDNVVLSDVGENGEVEITRSGKFSDIKISEYCIWRDWEGRELRRRDVVCAEDP
ncbi:hypothetical protein C8R43DRAFT_1032602 [Mycena crocata]|nr:hypothetical protein C8R43DRAFT_1032602 [Mycena crocata]